MRAVQWESEKWKRENCIGGDSGGEFEKPDKRREKRELWEDEREKGKAKRSV